MDRRYHTHHRLFFLDLFYLLIHIGKQAQCVECYPHRIHVLIKQLHYLHRLLNATSARSDLTKQIVNMRKSVFTHPVTTTLWQCYIYKLFSFDPPTSSTLLFVSYCYFSFSFFVFLCTFSLIFTYFHFHNLFVIFLLDCLVLLPQQTFTVIITMFRIVYQCS